MIIREIEGVIGKINTDEVYREVITHHLRTAGTYVSGYMEMCDNGNNCNNCKELICKNTQDILKQITSILRASNINETQKKELGEIPTAGFPNKKALEEIYKILNLVA